VALCCECGNEPSGSKECAEVFCLAEEPPASQEGLYSINLITDPAIHVRAYEVPYVSVSLCH
jgi:hypothetical protein